MNERKKKNQRPTDLSSVSSESSPSAIQLPPACSSLSVSNTAPPEQSSSALEHPLIKVRTSCMWVGVSWGETQAASAVNTTLIFICYINSSSYDNTFSWTTSPKGLENWMGQISSVESFLKAEKSCRRLSARGESIRIIISLSCKILHLNTTQLFCSHILHNAWVSNTELRFATFQVHNYICQLIFLFKQKDTSLSSMKNIIAKNIISFLCPEMFLLPLDNGINPRTPCEFLFPIMSEQCLSYELFRLSPRLQA